MTAPDLFSPVDFNKLVSEKSNGFVAVPDSRNYVIYHNNVPVGLYYPNAEHIIFVGNGTMSNPLVKYVADNSLLTPEQFRFVNYGASLSNVIIPEFGFGGLIWGTLIGGYLGYKVGRMRPQKEDVFEKERKAVEYGKRKIKEARSKRKHKSMETGGKVPIASFKAVRDATNKDRGTFGSIMTHKKGDTINVYRIEKYGDMWIEVNGRTHLSNSPQIASLVGKSNTEIAKLYDDYHAGKLFNQGGNLPCWEGYEMIGMKMKNGKEVPNCVPIDKKKTGGKVKVKRPMKVRFHLGAGKNFMTWRVENTDTKKVDFINPDENRLVMYNCRLTNRPTTAKKIFSGEINKQPIAWIECESLEVFEDQEIPMTLDQIRYNPRVNIHWHTGDDNNIDGMVFPKLVTYGRSVFVQDGDKFYELGGVIYDHNSVEDFDSVSTEPFDSLQDRLETGGKIEYFQVGGEMSGAMRKVLENDEFEYYWDYEDDDNAYMIRKSDGQQFYGYMPMDSMYNDILTGNYYWVAEDMQYNFEQIQESAGVMKRGGNLQSDAQAKFIYVMREFGKGKLKHGTTGDKVTDRNMASAIAYSEARKIDPDFGSDKMFFGGKVEGAIQYTFANKHGATTSILISPMRDNKWRVQTEEKQWSERYQKPVHKSESDQWLSKEDVIKLKAKIKRHSPTVKKY